MEMEKLLTSAANSQDIEVPNILCSMYSSDINFTKMMVQLKMLPDLVQSYKASNN